MSEDISIPRPGFAAPRRSEGLEPGTKRLIWIAGGLVVGLVGIVGVAGLVGRKPAEVPVVQAAGGPVRVKPENPGGMQVPGANNEMFSGGAKNGTSNLAPAPEAPDPKALRAATSAAVTAPPVATAPPPQVATPQPNAATAGLAAHPAAKPAPAPVAQPAPATAVQAARPASGTPATSNAGKAAMVQLAALPTEAAARAEWQSLTKKMPDLLNGRQPTFAKSERDGKVMWRIRTTGFNDVASARSFCERVRVKGNGCNVITG